MNNAKSDTAVRSCPDCGRQIQEDHFIKKPGGEGCCELCYFNNTYLEGVVESMDAAYLVTLEAFVSAIDAREHEVGNHSLRVTEFSLIIGKACGVKGRNLVDLYAGSLLHDLGKIGVPDAILLKAGPLNEKEQAIMHRHPDIGYRIIGHIGYFSRAAEIVRSHHEHYDGSGYPRGLKGDEITFGARVFAVADALDALTVTRPYHEAILFEAAMKVIVPGSGTLFDPLVVDAFLKSADTLKDYIGRIIFSESNVGTDDLYNVRR